MIHIRMSPACIKERKDSVTLSTVNNNTIQIKYFFCADKAYQCNNARMPASKSRNFWLSYVNSNNLALDHQKIIYLLSY